MKRIIGVILISILILACHRANQVTSVSLAPDRAPSYVQDRQHEFKSASETNFGGATGAGTGQSFSSTDLRSGTLKDKNDNPKTDSLVNLKQPMFE